MVDLEKRLTAQKGKQKSEKRKMNNVSLAVEHFMRTLIEE